MKSSCFTVGFPLLTRNEIKITVLNMCREYVMNVMTNEDFENIYNKVIVKYRNKLFISVSDLLELIMVDVLEAFSHLDIKRNGGGLLNELQ